MTTLDVGYLIISTVSSGLVASALDSGLRGPGSSPGRGHCVVFLGKKLNSHSGTLQQDV